MQSFKQMNSYTVLGGLEIKANYESENRGGPQQGIKKNAGMVITGKKELAEINFPEAKYIVQSSLCDLL